MVFTPARRAAHCRRRTASPPTISMITAFPSSVVPRGNRSTTCSSAPRSRRRRVRCSGAAARSTRRTSRARRQQRQQHQPVRARSPAASRPRRPRTARTRGAEGEGDQHAGQCGTQNLSRRARHPQALARDQPPAQRDSGAQVAPAQRHGPGARQRSCGARRDRRTRSRSPAAAGSGP